MSDKNQEIVWIQNLKGFINGQFPADERWKAIFIEQLNEVNARSLATQHHQGGEVTDEKLYASINSAGDGWGQVTISYPGAEMWTERYIEDALAQQPQSGREYIEFLERQNATLRLALEPFVRVADEEEQVLNDNDLPLPKDDEYRSVFGYLTFGDFRRARSAAKEKSE